MAFTERVLNGAIAEVLHPMSSKWKVTAELTGEIREGSGLTLDLFVHNYHRLPVVIENEFSPAAGVHLDAVRRLGKTLRKGDSVNFVVELVSPRELRNCTSLQGAREKIRNGAIFQYALLNGNSDQAYERFPESGYIQGSIRDVALFISNAGVAQDALETSITVLSEGVERAIHILHDEVMFNDALLTRLAAVLRQSFTEKRVKEALGIGVTVMVSALLFQQRLSGTCVVRNLAQMQSDDKLTQAGLLMEWNKVLEINYWSVFSIAKNFLYEIGNPEVANRLVSTVASTAQRLSDLGVTESHDLAGVVFQRFIADRKYLATFYTRPESAVLLTHLAIPMDVADTAEAYKGYRIADYACGTGTLIHAAYDRLSSLYDLTGNAPELLHSYMMENTLTAADIVPSAAHMTASMLSSVFPNQPYANTRVLIPEYGERSVGEGVALGSLELLDVKTELMSLFDVGSDTEFGSNSIVKIGGAGEEMESVPFIIDSGTDSLVIMNPPFTRAMSDWVAGNEGTWKQYNALGNTREVQSRMEGREKELGKASKCYNGYHALPSMFCGVADKMVKVGGRLALVLPMTSVQGVSWEKFRALLSKSYEDILVVGITASTADASSWSADTSLVEVLIIAQKANREQLQNRGTFISLHARPRNSMEASEVARSIQDACKAGCRSVEDGPYGGTFITVGETVVGEMISAPVTGRSWSPIGIRDLELAQFIESLNMGCLWFPGQTDTFEISVVQIGSFAQVGFAANNIANNRAAAFDRTEISRLSTYPMLWKANSSERFSMLTDPDMEGRVRQGKEELAGRIWDRRSWAHLAAEIGFSSQKLGAAFTEKQTIGGRSWPNVQLNTREEEEAFVVWNNSTLGLMQCWYHSSRQQGSRGILPVSSMEVLPCLNICALSDDALQHASCIFNDMKEQELGRICEAYKDPVRMEMDRRILTEVLGLDSVVAQGLDHVRRKWCAEPSIRGIRPEST